MKTRKRTMSAISAMVMAILCIPLPSTSLMASANSEWTKNATNTTIGTAGIEAPTILDGATGWTGNYVYYGKYDGNHVKYRVLAPSTNDFGGTTMLLDCDTTLINMAFAHSSNAWYDSDVRTWLTFNEFYESPSVFTTLERGAIIQSTKSAKADNDGEGRSDLKWTALSKDTVFLLDAKEASNSTYGYSDNNTRKKSGSEFGWWLRSPHYTYGYAVGSGFVNGSYRWYGEIDSCSETSAGVGVSPAFNVNLESVIFSSVVNPSTATDDTAKWGNEYKLTLKDDNTTVSTGIITNNNGTVTVPFTVKDSATDDSVTADQISVVIEKTTTTGTKSITLYQTQTIALTGGFATGNVVFTLPSDFSADTDKVYVVAQDVNENENKELTDYASELVDITDSISQPAILYQIGENGMVDVEVFKENDVLPESDGKLFAGWFTDSTCQTAYTEDNGRAYAKFIDEKILTVKAQISSGTTASSESTTIRFITSVDSLKYQNVGFKITFNGKTIDQKMTKVYTAINANGAKVKPTVFSADSHYMEAYTLNNIPKDAFGKTFTVTPYYTTQDGTIVDGATNTFTIANMIK